MDYTTKYIAIVTSLIVFVLSSDALSQTNKHMLKLSVGATESRTESQYTNDINTGGIKSPDLRNEEISSLDNQNRKAVLNKGTKSSSKSIEGFVNSLIKPFKFEGGRIRYSLNSWLTGAVMMDVSIWSLRFNYAEVSFSVKLPF